MTMRADLLQDATTQADGPAWGRDEFEAKLRERGKSYHIHHPFNVMLNTGRATPEQVRGWVANRWCELLPLGAQQKQRFMSLDNPLLRLELVADVLDQTGLAKSLSGRR